MEHNDPEHIRNLGEELCRRLNKYLSKSHVALISPGTLGAGMGVEVTAGNEHHQFGPQKGELIVTGDVRLRIYRNES